MSRVVDRVLEIFPNEEIYTCAAGISPSGPVHFGNFRDVMTSFATAFELRRRGREARLLFSWDDFDRFRKVPAGVDESFTQYIGMPLSRVPAPWRQDKSYARVLEEEFEDAMRELGIELIYRYQTEEYASGRYTELVARAMQQRHRIAEILLSFMSEKGKRSREIDEMAYAKEHYPVSVYSRFTGKDNTRILEYDGETRITYHCLDTNQRETVDFSEVPIVKLAWKIDWSMRWKAEGVVFEPGGHDHASPGGSYDTSSAIAREIFGIEPPVFVGYEFINLRGQPGKMSGSKGNAATPSQLLRIYQPELLKWLYLRKSPHRSFDLAFDTEIYRQYDEFEQAVQDFLTEGEGSAYARSLAPLWEELSHLKHRNPIPFRQAVAFGQIMQWDSAKVVSLVERMGFGYHADSVVELLRKAHSWLEDYNPQEMIAVRETVNQGYAEDMSEEARQQVRQLREFLLSTKEVSVKEIEVTVYGIPRIEGVLNSELKKLQRSFFRDVYQLLIDRDTGPRLATFIWAIGIERTAVLLNI
ncbi:lysine--tRNA ligase [Patescibacteria group bacterium]|nr:lysine--tRNA ligase [Patescibacteria group bacterium]